MHFLGDFHGNIGRKSFGVRIDATESSLHRAHGEALAELCEVETARKWRWNSQLIYTATTEVEAEQRLAEFILMWDAKFPMIAKSWRSNWTRVIVLRHPQEIRKVIYTTNAI